VGSDRYSAYESLPDPQRQLCWAHLIRNLRACLEYGELSRAWAEAMLWQVEGLFAVWEWYRAGQIERVQVQVLVAPIRAQIEELLRQSKLDAREAEALRADLLKHWQALWTFVRVERVEPTNNAAERALLPRQRWSWRRSGAPGSALCLPRAGVALPQNRRLVMCMCSIQCRTTGCSRSWRRRYTMEVQAPLQQDYGQAFPQWSARSLATSRSGGDGWQLSE
jgi:hypothetical protein